MTIDRPVPPRPHPRAIRSSGGWLVRRLTLATVRVTSPDGYLDVPWRGLALCSDLTNLAAHAVERGATWTPVRRPSGPSGPTTPHRDRSGERLDVYLGAEASRCLTRLVQRLGGTRRAHVERAIVAEFERLGVL